MKNIYKIKKIRNIFVEYNCDTVVIEYITSIIDKFKKINSMIIFFVQYVH